MEDIIVPNIPTEAKKAPVVISIVAESTSDARIPKAKSIRPAVVIRIAKSMFVLINKPSVFQSDLLNHCQPVIILQKAKKSSVEG
jgi:hypothetical protein